MNIAGVLILAYPGQNDKAREALLTLEGVEVHHETDDGRFIVTVEDGEDSSCDKIVLDLHNTPGVASAALVYHNFEPENAIPSPNHAAPSASPIRGA